MRYSLISKYRTPIMGVAMVWIAFLHASMYFPGSWFNWLFKLTGQGGVDIFFFMSSFGLYYSWQKNPNTQHFWMRRFLRVVPFFLPVAQLRSLYFHYETAQAVSLLTATSFFIFHDRSMWYISAILLFYFFTPFYLRMFRGREKLCTILAIILSVAAGLLFLNTDYLLLVARIPIFLLGFYVGWLSEKDKPISPTVWIVELLLLLVGFACLRYSWRFGESFLWGYGAYWYPFLLITVPFGLLIAWFFQQCERLKLSFIPELFSLFGKVSLCFYLLHELVLHILSDHFFWTVDPYNIVFNMFVIALTLGAATLYQKGIGLLVNKLTHKEEGLPR